MMMGVKSSESAKHDADQGDENPGGGAGFGFLVVAHEPSVLPEPAKGALDHPAFGQHLEAAGVVAALDDFHFQFGSLTLDPRREVFSGGATIDPQFAQPGEVRQHRSEHRLGSGPLGRMGWLHGDSQQPAEGIDQHKAFAALGLFARVVTDVAAVRIGAHGLAVEDAGGGLRPLAGGLARPSAEFGVERGQKAAAAPVPEVMIDRFPRRKALRQQPPRAAGLDQIQNGGPDDSQGGAWAAPSFDPRDCKVSG